MIQIVGRGDWIQTFSGRRFYPANPRAEDMDINDVAHALSMVCRFNGHVRFHYSVAQHAVLCARRAAAEYAYEALHHDDSETWITDLTRPVKRMLPPYVTMESNIDRVKCQWLGLPFPMSPAVKLIDDRMLVTEASQLLSGRGEEWWREPHWPKPYDMTIEEWTPAYAEDQFLIEHVLLQRKHQAEGKARKLKWPDQCRDASSCAKNRACGYRPCAHQWRDIRREIEG